MSPYQQTRIDRRMFQKLCLTVPAPIIAAVWGYRALGSAQGDATPGLPDATATAAADATRTAILPVTPACGDGDDDEITPPQVEGPFYTPDAPERTNLREPDMPGTLLTVAGYVLTADCRPVPGALVDFWQADGDGVYDNEGFTLRGYQFADDDGRYYLETIVPGLYPGRTSHLHVRVQAPDGPVLTTQLYFPDVPENDQDGFYDPALLLDIGEAAGRATPDTNEDDEMIGLFTFVVASR